MQNNSVLSHSRWTFIEDKGKINGVLMTLYRCECGNKKIVTKRNVERGISKSCGCLRKELQKANPVNVKHGLSRSSIYQIWYLMMRRCYNPQKGDYKFYGGRGIRVCEQWHDVIIFIEWCNKNGYSEGLQIDRFPDKNGNYEPGNIRFVTSKENNNNRRDNRIIEYNGRIQTLQQWADETGIETSKIRARIDRLKWPVEKALTVK